MIIRNSGILGLNDSLERFKNISKKSAKTLAKHGIELNFKGYENFIDELSMVDDTSTESVLQVIKMASFWKEYFDGVVSVVHMTRMGVENKQLYLEAFRDPIRENKKLEVEITKNKKELEVIYNYELFVKMISKTINKAIKEMYMDQKELFSFG